MSLLRVVPVVLLLAILPSVELEPVQRRHKRQSIDTTGITDQELIECFAALARGEQCSSLTLPPPPPDPDNCQCVPDWQCRDREVAPTVNTADGILKLVNVRTGVGSTCTELFHRCCINVDLSATPPPPPPSPQQPVCGQLKPQGVANTHVGFKEGQSQFGQHPWMAAVMTTGVAGANGNNIYVSGGSLIHPGVVMTAAHYMDDYVSRPEALAVRLGEWDFKLPSEPIPHQDIRVSRIVLHPDYVRNQLTYDIALLFLERNAELGPTVGTICLPDPFETFDGDICYSSGWGKDVFGQTGQYQQILKSLALPAVNHGQCQAALRTTRLSNTFNLHKSFMCAGGGTVDTCTGDGGSPLVCPDHHDPNIYVQTGIVSWGIGCGEDGIPGVYASVSEAVAWIGQQLQTVPSFDVRRGPGNN